MPLKNFFNNKMLAILSAIIIALSLSALFLPLNEILNYLKYEFSNKNDFTINLNLVNQGISVLTADPSNRLVLRAEVRDRSGRPVPSAHVKFYVSNGVGNIYLPDVRTDNYGECLASYLPPSTVSGLFEKDNVKVNLTAGIYGTSIKSSISIKLTPTPVVFVHGYQASGAVFDNMKEYLDSKGFKSAALSYKSEEGVAAGAKELNRFLRQLKAEYLSGGIQVKKFDVVAHSIGGLVTRYYTSSEDYIRNNDVRKIIFISVPHRGSHLASLGMAYFDDKAIRDLVPGNDLLTRVLPSMINKGLNNSIQVGSIMGQYDEVVSSESASLDEWNIKTEVFNVGDNNLTMDSLLDGSIMESQNHKTILNNLKVFEKVEEMLKGSLPYPSAK